MNNNPFADLIGTGSAQGASQGGYEQLFAEYIPKKAPKKKKDFMTDQISTAGGVGGALAGAAGGAALGSVVPVIGTAIGGIAGGIIGGALGSGAGEYAENVVTDEEDKFKNVGTEALLGGIFAAPPLRLAKGAAAAGKAGLAGKGGAKVAFEKAFAGTTKAVTRTGAERAALSATGEAWGIRPGVKSTGTIITPQRAKELQNFSKTVIGVPKTSSADMVFERAVNHQKQVGSSISSAIQGLPEGSVDIKGLSKNVSNRFSKLLGVDPSKNQVAKDIMSQLKAAKTPQELWELRKSIDNELINFSRNPASTIPGAEQAARAARSEISTALSKAVPALKDLNKQYSNVVDVINLTADAARTPKGFKIPGFQQTVGGATAQRVKAGAGNTLESARAMTNNVATGDAAKQATGGALRLGARQAIGQNVFSPQEQPSLEDSLMQSQDMGVLGGNEFATSPMQQPVEQSPYPRENLMMDIQRDPKNADKYIAYYQQLQEVYAQPEAQKFSSASAGTISDFESSLSELDNLENGIISGGGTTDPLMGRLRSLNPYDTEQQSLRAMIDKTRQIVGKALEGGVLRKEDEEKYKKILPTTDDTKEVALKKIAAIRSQLQYKLQSYSGLVGNGGGTLEDALIQQQGAF